MQFANLAFYDTFSIDEAETKGRPLYTLDGGQWGIPRLRALFEEVRAGTSLEDFELRQIFPRLGQRVLVLNVRLVLRDEEAAAMILLAIEDATDKEGPGRASPLESRTAMNSNVIWRVEDNPDDEQLARLQAVVMLQFR